MQLDALQSLAFLGPELALAATVLVVLLLVARGLDGGAIALAGAALSFVLAAGLDGWGEVWLSGRLLVVDGVAVFAKLVIALALVAAIWIARDAANAPRLLAAALALDLAASSANAWMAAATVWLSWLALARRRDSFVPSIAALAGVAGLAGLAGSADFESMRRGLFEVAPQHGVAVSIAVFVLVSASLVAFASIALRPAHDDCGLAVAIAFSAGLVALLSRFLLGALSEPAAAGRWVAPEGMDWRPLVALAACATITWGGATVLRAAASLEALGGASIISLGCALGGLSRGTVDGLRAALFLTGLSALVLIGVFFVAARRGESRLAIEDVCFLVLLAAATIAVVLHPAPLLRFAARSATLLPF